MENRKIEKIEEAKQVSILFASSICILLILLFKNSLLTELK